MISDWMEVQSEDPNDARRRRLLNILLLGVASIALLGVIVAAVSTITGQLDNPGLLWGTSATLVSTVVVYLLNRYGSGQLASSLFLIILTLVLTFTDEPRQVVEGRSTFLFTIPILMASVILRPWASFLMAALSSVVIATVAIVSLEDYAQGAPPIPSMLGFFAFAFVAWLSARSLENALENVREINRELDQRVELRTRELRQANDQLARANERLLELDRLKSRFVSMVSHELRTPLSAIQGFVEVLLAGIYGPLTDRQQNALGRITSNTQRLLGLVNDLLDQARIEAGELNLRIQPFAVESLLADVHATMDVLAQSKGLTLTVESSGGLPELIYGDEARLRQILVNLINNSLKFTEEGGVAVRCYPADGDGAYASPQWALVVSDTGPGIGEEDQAHIFQPFRRVDDSATRTKDGVGLGLAIVKELVELMEGEISLESELGKGSSFTIMLPLQPYEEEGS